MRFLQSLLAAHAAGLTAAAPADSSADRSEADRSNSLELRH